MLKSSKKSGGSGTRRRRLGAVTATALTSCLLAALPTASASAASPQLAAVESGKVTSLLDQVGLSTLGTAQLVEALDGLPQLESLGAGTVQAALTSAIEKLQGEGANLGELLGSPLAVAQLEESLKEALGPPLAELLGSLLGGDPTAELTEALGSLNSSEVVGSVIGSTSEPEKAIGEALGSIPSAELEETLGALPTGEGFSKGTVEQLAGQVGLTPEQLAKELGDSSEELPPTAMALTGALANSTKLGVVKSVTGIGMAVLGTAGGLEGTGNEGGGPGGSGSGGSGGAGGGAGSTTIVLQVPGSGPSQTGTVAGAGHRVRIVSHHVHGHTLTVVVSVPSAGTVSLAGRGIRALRRHAARAGTLTLRTTLTKAAVASLSRRRHGKLKTAVKVGFRPTAGAASSAGARVSFR